MDEVKKYCLSLNSEEIEQPIENIFKYVAPKYLFVPRDNEKKIIAIMCNYRFDMDNGIAVVFEDGELSEIGSQNIIL